MPVIEIPPTIEVTPRGSQSTERAAIEEHDKTTLESIYFSVADIPPTPAEPPAHALIPDEDIDRDCKQMMPGSEIEAFFGSGSAPSVAQLVDQHVMSPQQQQTANQGTMGQGVLPGVGGFDGGKIDPKTLQNLIATLGLPPVDLSGLGAVASAASQAPASVQASGPPIAPAAMLDSNQQYMDPYVSQQQPQWGGPQNTTYAPASSQPPAQAAAYGYGDMNGYYDEQQQQQPMEHDQSWGEQGRDFGRGGKFDRGRGGRGRGRGRGRGAFGVDSKGRRKCEFYARGR